MGSSGSFPIDLVLFGMIAAFLVLRLRSILGRRTGFERPPMQEPGLAPRTAPEGRIIDGMAEPAAAAPPARPLPDPASPPGQALARMQGVDRNFNAAQFLGGAEAAFRMIVTAFATGDRATLRALLSDDTYRAFEAAITAREAANERQQTELRAIHSATIEAADLRGTIADITVRFVTDQVNVTFGANGLPVAGADAVTEITDLWTFERDLTSTDPTWRLVAARSA
ncbi:Tim44 domain-containing protein [Rhodovastum atsumiense]|uniref:Tim44 domain-containing protein n=1 Tax=Rhodovastum atsumiense TaxID=504468 RepID=A0A5M6INK6_9PROT|nr:Tim44/TimA family putative adaptor protein [Rhodovastum atsumiense]KAA5609489.1 Tim44 domain-containing protein [Rhodovastum atsumiense]CAH2600814.1 Tim44 domain-containing protein [Rhodovastum atsumiense]